MVMKSSKKKFIIGIMVVLLVAALIWFFTRNGKESEGKYTMVQIDRGDLEAVVSSTGTLSAVTTVQVGTQVSGRIAKLYADFNQTVKKGELLAMLDTSSLLMAVSEAESSYDRSKAQLKQSRQDLERMQYLFKENIKTKNDLEQAQVNFELAQATLKSSQSSLERARINLSFASIYAPIDGIVISRSIDVGQTVAASFSSPTLFLIANDLSKMQILANVDESDIGQIKEDQEVRFTVQAQVDKKFSGVVSQIRLEPTTIQNVVSYTVVINVANNEGLLLPGMTATIDFLDRPGQKRPARGQRRPAFKTQPGNDAGADEAICRQNGRGQQNVAGRKVGRSGSSHGRRFPGFQGKRHGKKTQGYRHTLGS